VAVVRVAVGSVSGERVGGVVRGGTFSAVMDGLGDLAGELAEGG